MIRMDKMMTKNDKFTILSGSVQKIVAGNHQEASEDLMYLANEILDVGNRPSDLNFLLFALALYKRLDPSTEFCK